MPPAPGRPILHNHISSTLCSYLIQSHAKFTLHTPPLSCCPVLSSPPPHVPRVPSALFVTLLWGAPFVIELECVECLLSRILLCARHNYLFVQQISPSAVSETGPPSLTRGLSRSSESAGWKPLKWDRQKCPVGTVTRDISGENY